LAKQNATDHDRQYFQQQQYELQQLVQKLRLEIDNFNQNIVELNRKIDSLNSLDQQLDSSVKLYRQLSATPFSQRAI
jgi:exonuclease VII small subunit